MHSSGLESYSRVTGEIIGSALGIAGKKKSHFSRSPFPESFTSTLNVPMVHCAILLLAVAFFVFQVHLRRLGTTQTIYGVPCTPMFCSR